MKKLLVILALVLCFAVIFVACGDDKPEDTTAAKTDAPTEAPTTEAPTTEEPTTDEPTTDEPTTDEPTTDEPTTDEPTTDEPTTDTPTTGGGEEETTEETILGLKEAGKGMASDDGYFENGANLTPTGQANTWYATNRGANGTTGVDSIGFHGWAMYGDGKEVAVEAYGWSLLKNREEMSDIVWDGEIILDEAIIPALGGAAEARRYTIAIDLTALETAEYDVYLYVKFANGEVYKLDCFTDVWVNHVNSFMSTSASATAQEDIDAGYGGSVLTESALGFTVFDKGNGIFAGDPGLITTNAEGVAVWKFQGGFGDYWTEATGKYAYTLVFEAAGNKSGGGFVRGWSDGFTGWDAGYFGAACPGPEISEQVAHGKAGIYYYVKDGNLTIVIKGWNPDNALVPNVSTIIVPNVSKDVTVIDLGDVVYFKSGEFTVAKVELVGSTTYGDITAPMTESATVKTWDNQTVEVANALIHAELVGSQFGISSRIAQFELSAASFGSAAGVSYAANLDVATSIATDKAVYSEGDFIYAYASHKEAALVGIAPTGTTNWITYYAMGEQEGFADIPVGVYDVVVADMSGNILKSVTVEVIPSTLVASYGAADIVARPNDAFGATFGCVPSLSEDGTYATLTMDPEAFNPAIGGAQGGDYNWYLAFPAVYNVTASNYMVIKYRTSATNIDKQEMFIATTSVAFAGAGSNINFTDKMVCDGEWNYLYINFEDYGVTDMNTCSILRFDFINGADKGSTMDIEYINFYKTAEDAYKSTLEPLVFDEVSDYATANNIFAPGCGNAGFEAVYGAINGNMGNTADPNGYPGINGGDLLWLSNTEATIDLSKYSKAVITYTCDTSDVTKNGYNDTTDKFEILNFESTLATGQYTLTHNSWCWNTCEIDLSGVDYNGEVLLRMNNGGIPGTWYVIQSVVLVP